jgi:folate-binding protein YgfZ
MTAPTLTGTDAVRAGVGAIAGLRQAVMAEGPEAESFLQGQLSQDIASMAPHESRWSLLLHPQGKISAWLRVTRLDGERFLLDVDTDWADEVVTRLTRFKLRTKCELTISPWTSLTIVGHGALNVEVDNGELELHDSWAGLPIVIVFGDNPTADVPEIEFATATALRIEAGRPAMGAELDESTIPAAAGIVDQSVSFTKGCYTGQELVARIDSRGNNVPRRLVGLVFDGAAATDDVEMTVDGQGVGVVTTAGHSGVLGCDVALAYATRAVEVGDVVQAGGTTATVRELPLVAG